MRLLIRCDYTQHEVYLIWKSLVKLANIYVLQALSVNWCCNHDRGSQNVLHHLLCNILGNTPQCQQ